MKDDNPFNAKPYPIPFIFRQEVREQIKDMQKDGIISAAKTEYVSPLVAVTKKDNSVRVCLDARQLNARMNPDYVQPPNINELLLNFKKGHILSTLDLTAAYWQIPIKEDHKKYIGFVYEGQSYVFNVLPLGLSTSMASLIRCLSIVLGDESTEFTVCYVDDLLVFSENLDEHFKHLRIIFTKLQNANLTVKLRKSRFFRDEIPFLGHIISTEGIRLDEKRIESIQNFAEPRNIKDLRGFLGLVNYEQRFCNNYAELTIPLLKLLKKGVSWIWGVDQKDAFSKIKEAYLHATLVVHPNLEDTFFIQCDSSAYAMGGCLFQKDRVTGNKAVIAFTSKTFKGSQLNYTVTEKEAMSAVHCLRQWRALILGRELVIITDHKSLTFVMKCHLKSARLIRWVMYIQEFNCKIVHCSGLENVTADILSRYPQRDHKANRPDENANIQCCLLKLSPDYKQLRRNFKNIRADQRADVFCQIRIQILEDNAMGVKVLTVKELRTLEWYTLYDGMLFRRGDGASKGFKLCVPRDQCLELIKVQHEEIGHFGKTKTYEHLREKFFWPKMQKHVRKVVASCGICQKTKASKRSAGIMSPILVQKPGQLVCVDLMGPLPMSRGGATVLLVLVDAFSKYVKLYALKRATTRSILNRIFKSYLLEVQKPESLLSDNGTQFTSRLWQDTLTDAGIKVKHISIYFPQGNITERYNREIGRLLRLYCHEKHTKWACMLEHVELCLNNVINDSTGYQASFLQMGRVKENRIHKLMNFPEQSNDILTREQHWEIAYRLLRTKAERRAAKANAKIQPVNFSEGDQVLVRTHTQSSAEDRTIKKFFLLYEGPYRVAKQAGPNSYIIADDYGNTIGKHNVLNLKLYKTPVVNLD